MARRRYKNPYFKLARWFLMVAIVADVFSLLLPMHKIKPVIDHLSLPASQPASIAWPGYGESALGAKGYGTLASNGGNTPRPTASVAKTLTALAVLKEKPLQPNEDGPIINLTQADVDIYQKFSSENGSVIPVAVGEQLNERQMLEAMLLPSANNMAVSLASWAFGSTTAFNAYANNLAHSLGMRSTTITDPSGFDPSTVSTAQDLTLLASAALDSPTLSQIVNEQASSVPLAGEIKNLNSLVGSEGVVGIKTGNTDQAGGVFIFAANRVVQGQTVKIYGAIMGAPSLRAAMDDGLTLIKSADGGFSYTKVVSAGQSLGYYQGPSGIVTNVIATSDTPLLYWRSQPVSARINLTDLRPGTKAQAAAGNIKISSGEYSLRIPATTQAPIPKPSLIWRLLHPWL